MALAGVQLDHIAEQMRAAGSARTRFQQVGVGESALFELTGVWDLRREHGLVRFEIGGEVGEVLYAGRNVFQLHSSEEQERTGRMWRCLEERPADWADDWRVTTAAVHRRSRPLGSKTEQIAGEPVHRYSLAIRPHPDEDDPLLAATGDQMQRYGIKRLTFDVWLGADGTLRQTREHLIFYRRHANRTGVAKAYRDLWDFGAELPDLSVPPPEAVLWTEPESPRPGLQILIDGEVSPY